MKYNELDNSTREALVDYLLHLADNQLVLGHRLSEWCGHGPMLEEDIALANIALDCVGQANNFYILAAQVEDKNRSADDLAYLRDTIDFRNFTIAELPKGDFGFTIARQFLFCTYIYLLYKELQNSKLEDLAAIAQKSLKEVTYHLRHCSEWVLRLGDGTEDSKKRIQQSFDDLWHFTSEFFVLHDNDAKLAEQQIISPLISGLEDKYNAWFDIIQKVCQEATLTIYDDKPLAVNRGREGKHTEYLGHMLAEMQILPRSYPGATW